MSRIVSGFDAGRFPGYGDSTQMPVWWGMVGLIVVESTVFATLVASYFYLGLRQPEWPLPGVADPALAMPTAGTALLLASSALMHVADRSVGRGDARTLLRGLLGCIVLAVAFLALKAVEYGGKEFRWDSHPYGSIVWLIVAFHSAHVVSLVLKTAVVAVLARRGFFHRDNRLAVTVNGFYWHFVVAVWVPLYAVIYLSPRLS
jgi:heme/copper-type cytochrome/quinol oxidase subunit 3